MFKRMLATYRRGKILEIDEISSRRPWMSAIARNAAKDAVHYYLAWRTLDWWREAIDEAEKSGEKYVRLADLVAKIEEENK